MLMVIVTVAESEVPKPLVAVIPKVDVPATVGVPLITPVEALMARPTGSVPVAIA